MEFIKKYWYYSVILGLILYIFTFPKKVYKVIPKETQKYEKVIDLLIDSINNLNSQKNELLLLNNSTTQVETLTVTVKSPPQQKIIYKNDTVIQESDCIDFYSDRKLDSLWTGGRVTKKNNFKR